MPEIPFNLTKEQAQKVYEWYETYLNRQDVIESLDRHFFGLKLTEEQIWEVSQIYTEALHEEEYNSDEVLYVIDEYLSEEEDDEKEEK